MKINELLLEAHGLEQVLAQIKRDCKPFLSKADKALWRGINGKSSSLRELSDGIYRGTARTDRMPRDSNTQIHKIVDDALEKHFGIRGRSQSLFVTTNPNVADSYGKLHLIFPIGQFKILWSPYIYDVFSVLQDNFSSMLADEPVFKFFKKELKAMGKDVGDLDYMEFEEQEALIKKILDEQGDKIFSTNFKKSQGPGAHNSELMLVVPEYYAISKELYDDHAEMIDDLFRH
jgi:hypothetical protein